MKRYQSRTPLLAVLLIAAVMFGATTWVAAHVTITMRVLEPLVATALVLCLGVRRLAAAFHPIGARTSKSSRTEIREIP